MGNTAITGMKKKKTAKIMKIDGTTLRFKPPIQAKDVLCRHPGYDLLESEEVKRLGISAQPLHPNHPLHPGKLYFLIELPRVPDNQKGPPRRAWSGALHMSAKDRLESLMLTRRSVSDLSVNCESDRGGLEEKDGGVRMRMRLPRAEVARIVDGSKDAAEAAEKIMELCRARETSRAAITTSTTPPMTPVRTMKEVKLKRTRFMPRPEEITT